jgi:hypothetical protein
MEKFNVKNGLSVGVDKLSIIDAVGSLSAASVTVNSQYTLPSLDGTSSQVIATDGSGNLSFISLSSGSDVSSLSANWESTYTTVSTNSSSWGPQTIAFNESTANLTIENGNTISLSALSAAITLPVVDTTAIASDPVDSTKRVRLDAGAVAAGQTRAIQVPNGDCRVRDCIRFEILDSSGQWTKDVSYWLGHIGGSFLIESIAGVCFDATGCLETPKFELFRDGNSIGGPISLSNSVADGTLGLYGELAINDNPGISSVLYVNINDDGSGSAGNRAYGLVVTVIGYWNIL